jgi:cache domain-containing protein
MPFEPAELRISLQKLLIGLILTIVPLSILGLYITTQSDKSLEQALGAQYKGIAEASSAAVGQFINDRITECRLLTASPVIQDAIAASNRPYERMSETAAKDRIDRMKATWNTDEAGAVSKAALSSPASRLLRRQREIDPRFLRIIVSDQRGATVAATDKPADYFQGEEAYWQGVYAQGKGATAVRDAIYDQATKSSYIGVAVPITDQASGQFIGAAYALIEISGLVQQFSRETARGTSKTILTKRDGTVIAAPSVNLSTNLKSEEFLAARDALSTVQGRQAGYVVSGLDGGRRSVIGFADTGLSQQYPNLGWIVIVSQDLREATAPVRPVIHFAQLMVVLGLLMLTLMALYFFLHRREEFEELEPLPEVLHPKTSTAGK